MKRTVAEYAIDLVWLKRDLRTHDHAPIQNALKSGRKVLLAFFWEAFYEKDLHYSFRHRQFIAESLMDLDRRLSTYDSSVAQFRGQPIEILKQIQNRYDIRCVHSHMETGLQVSYKRDRAVANYLKICGITWNEYMHNGVGRGLRNRSQWKAHWLESMGLPQLEFRPASQQLLSTSDIRLLEQDVAPSQPRKCTDENVRFQKGGITHGMQVWDSFAQTRYRRYNQSISKPRESRQHCSRLSPYIAWGNLSVRQIYQAGKSRQKELENPKLLSGFLSRLRWQAHFIQKFEMECRMEFEPLNRGFLALNKRENPAWISAWECGETGFPLVDASMRCLLHTGYLNFRMRALLVSFATHA